MEIVEWVRGALRVTTPYAIIAAAALLVWVLK